MKKILTKLSKKQFLIIAAVCAVLVVGLVFWLMNQNGSDTKESQKTKTTTAHNKTAGTKKEEKKTEPTPAVAPAPAAFDKQKLSLSDPASNWLVVNKKRPLDPRSYAPSDLVVPHVTLRSNITGNEKYMRAEPAAALEKLFAGASAAGLQMNVQSGYRSYGFQESLYNRYVSQQGQAVADTQSARPGYSEHQTGLSVDVGSVGHPECAVEQCFADTAEGKWLAAHAYEYGFIIRYPNGKDAVTGYIYEPWHIRYVGTELATEMHTTGAVTLEEFFGLPPASSY